MLNVFFPTLYKRPNSLVSRVFHLYDRQVICKLWEQEVTDLYICLYLSVVQSTPSCRKIMISTFLNRSDPLIRLVSHLHDRQVM